MNPSRGSTPTLSNIRQTVRFQPVHIPVKISGWQQFWGEAYRPFFLLGWLVSLVGLSAWPLFFAGVFPNFPGPMHANLMVQGFFTLFAIGFLWTAMPAMIEVPGPKLSWKLIGLTLGLANLIAHFTGYHRVGHLLFIGLIGLFAGFAILRFPARRDLPPPSFVLVALGLIASVFGTALVLAGESNLVGPIAYQFGKLLLTQIFLLFLVMGVSAFLAPRFLGQKARQGFPESRFPDAIWKKRAIIAGLTSAVILVGTCFQAFGHVRVGALLIAVPVSAYVLHHVAIWRLTPPHNFLAIGMRIALSCSIAAPWMLVIWPHARLAAAHLLLLGGFGLLTLIVGIRVTFGHGGYEHLFQTRLKPVGVVVGLYMVSLISRLAGEVFPGSWKTLLFVSSLSIITAHLAWGVYVIPKMLRPNVEEEKEKNSPAATQPIVAPPLMRLPLLRDPSEK